MRAPRAHDVGGGVCDATCSIDAATRHRDTRCIDGDARNRTDVTLEGAEIGCGEWRFLRPLDRSDETHRRWPRPPVDADEVDFGIVVSWPPARHVGCATEWSLADGLL
jgi:hypothetical protein